MAKQTKKKMNIELDISHGLNGHVIPNSTIETMKRFIGCKLSVKFFYTHDADEDDDSDIFYVPVLKLRGGDLISGTGEPYKDAYCGDGLAMRFEYRGIRIWLDAKFASGRSKPRATLSWEGWRDGSGGFVRLPVDPERIVFKNGMVG